MCQVAKIIGQPSVNRYYYLKSTGLLVRVRKANRKCVYFRRQWRSSSSVCVRSSSSSPSSKATLRNDKTKTSYLISFVFGRPARRNLLNLCCSHQKLSTNFAIQCQIPNEIHRVKMLGFFRLLSLLPLSFCSMVL